MAARFQVSSAFRVHRRGLCVCGEILEGTVHVGMKARLNQPRPAIAATVTDLGYADDAARRESQVALGVTCTTPADEEALEAACRDGGIVLVLE